MFVCIRSSLHSVRFGQLLRCTHKRIVDITKVYIERNNMKVELIRFHKKILTVFTFTFGKRGIFRPTQCLRRICVIDYNLLLFTPFLTV